MIAGQALHLTSFFALMQSFYDNTAKRSIKGGMVLAYQSSGEYLRFNPHYHAIILEGGVDEDGRFVHIPFGDLQRMSEYFRRMIIKFFLKKQLINASVKDDLSGLRGIQAQFPGYRALFSDKAGNEERMAYLYDDTKLTLLEKVGEIAVPEKDQEDIKLPGVSRKFRGFDRD